MAFFGGAVRLARGDTYRVVESLEYRFKRGGLEPKALDDFSDLRERKDIGPFLVSQPPASSP